MFWLPGFPQTLRANKFIESHLISEHMKKIALMQPYFMPYVGYFSLIHAVDEFYLFEEPQFTSPSYMHRNQLPNANGKGLFYIRVATNPRALKTSIRDITIPLDKPWKEVLIRQLISTYGSCRYGYKKESLKVIEEILSPDISNFTLFIQHATKIIAAYLGIETRISIAPPTMFNHAQCNSPSDWAITFCEHLSEPAQFVNAIGGRKFLEKESFHHLGCELQFIEHDCVRNSIENELVSIIHLMMTMPKPKLQERISAYLWVEPR